MIFKKIKLLIICKRDIFLILAFVHANFSFHTNILVLPTLTSENYKLYQSLKSNYIDFFQIFKNLSIWPQFYVNFLVSPSLKERRIIFEDSWDDDLVNLERPFCWMASASNSFQISETLKRAGAGEEKLCHLFFNV